MINDLLRITCDALAELPKPSPEWEGAICYVKAEKAWYGCDGAQWVLMAKGKK